MLTKEILAKYNRRELMMSFKAAQMAMNSANKVGNGNAKTIAAKRLRIHKEFMAENGINF